MCLCGQVDFLIGVGPVEAAVQIASRQLVSARGEMVGADGASNWVSSAMYNGGRIDLSSKPGQPDDPQPSTL